MLFSRYMTFLLILFVTSCLQQKTSKSCGTGQTFDAVLRKCVVDLGSNYQRPTPPIPGPSISINEDGGATTFNLTEFTDLNSPAQSLTYSIVQLPQKGTLTNCLGLSGATSVNDLTCTYTPTADANGTDTFTYSAKNNNGFAVTAATATIYISAVNDPFDVSLTSVNIYEDTTAQTITIAPGADYTDAESDKALTCSAVSGDVAKMTITSCTCTPAPTANGICSLVVAIPVANLNLNQSTGVALAPTFDLTLIDVNGVSTLKSGISVVVDQVNDAPSVSLSLTNTIDAITEYTLNVDEGGGTDEDTETLSVSVNSSNTTLLPNENIEIVYNASTIGYGKGTSNFIELNDSGDASSANIVLKVNPMPGVLGQTSNLTVVVKDNLGLTTTISPIITYTGPVTDTVDNIPAMYQDAALTIPYTSFPLVSGFTLPEDDTTGQNYIFYLDEGGKGSGYTDSPPTILESAFQLKMRITSSNSSIISAMDTGAAGSVALTWNSLTRTATGTASSADYLIESAPGDIASSQITSLTFIPLANAHGSGQVTIQVSDDEFNTNILTRVVPFNITSVNDDPTITFSTASGTGSGGMYYSFVIDEGGGTLDDDQSLSVSVNSSSPSFLPNSNIQIFQGTSPLGSAAGASTFFDFLDFASDASGLFLNLKMTPDFSSTPVIGPVTVNIIVNDSSSGTTTSTPYSVDFDNPPIFYANVGGTSLKTFSNTSGTEDNNFLMSDFWIDEGGFYNGIGGGKKSDTTTDEAADGISLDLHSDNSSLVAANAVLVSYGGSALGTAGTISDATYILADGAGSSIGSGLSLTLVPTANSCGSGMMTMTANDGTMSTVKTFNYNFGCVNDPPQIVNSANFLAGEDSFPFTGSSTAVSQISSTPVTSSGFVGSSLGTFTIKQNSTFVVQLPFNKGADADNSEIDQKLAVSISSNYAGLNPVFPSSSPFKLFFGGTPGAPNDFDASCSGSSLVTCNFNMSTLGSGSGSGKAYSSNADYFTLNISPQSGYPGSGTFTITLTDNGSGSNTSTYTFTVDWTNIEDAPQMQIDPDTTKIAALGLSGSGTFSSPFVIKRNEVKYIPLNLFTGTIRGSGATGYEDEELFLDTLKIDEKTATATSFLLDSIGVGSGSGIHNILGLGALAGSGSSVTGIGSSFGSGNQNTYLGLAPYLSTSGYSTDTGVYKLTYGIVDEGKFAGGSGSGSGEVYFKVIHDNHKPLWSIDSSLTNCDGSSQSASGSTCHIVATVGDSISALYLNAKEDGSGTGSGNHEAIDKPTISYTIMDAGSFSSVCNQAGSGSAISYNSNLLSTLTYEIGSGTSYGSASYVGPSSGTGSTLLELNASVINSENYFYKMNFTQDPAEYGGVGYVVTFNDGGSSDSGNRNNTTSVTPAIPAYEITKNVCLYFKPIYAIHNGWDRIYATGVRSYDEHYPFMTKDSSGNQYPSSGFDSSNSLNSYPAEVRLNWPHMSVFYTNSSGTTVPLTYNPTAATSVNAIVGYNVYRKQVSGITLPNVSSFTSSDSVYSIFNTTSVAATGSGVQISCTTGTSGICRFYENSNATSFKYVQTTETSLSDNTAQTAIVPGKRYIYLVKPIIQLDGKTFVSSFVDNTDDVNLVRVIVPPDNMALVHRWMANKETCENMGKTPDRDNDYRCAYTGPGNTGSTHFDFGSGEAINGSGIGAIKEGDLFIDITEAACVSTLSHQGSGSAPTGMGSGDVIYDRKNQTCYFGSGAASIGVNVSDSAVGTGSGYANALSGSGFSVNIGGFPPLVNVDQVTADNICSGDLILCNGSGCTGTEFTGYTKALPNKIEQTASAAWMWTDFNGNYSEQYDGSSWSDTDLGNVESGSLASGCNSLVNSTFSNPVAENNIYYFNSVNMAGAASDIRDGYTSTNAAKVRSVVTGSYRTRDCTSRYGAQDMVGNVMEWTKDTLKADGGNTRLDGTVSLVSFGFLDLAAGSGATDFNGFFRSTGYLVSDLSSNTNSSSGYGSGTGVGYFNMVTGFLSNTTTNTGGFMNSLGSGTTTAKLHKDAFYFPATSPGADYAPTTGGAFGSGSGTDSTTFYGTHAGRYTNFIQNITSANPYTGFRCKIRR